MVKKKGEKKGKMKIESSGVGCSITEIISMDIHTQITLHCTDIHTRVCKVYRHTCVNNKSALLGGRKLSPSFFPPNFPREKLRDQKFGQMASEPRGNQRCESPPCKEKQKQPRYIYLIVEFYETQKISVWSL